MVRGLHVFKEYFKDCNEQYVLIGGAACDILFSNNNVNFRVTRDLDIVLIIEALSEEFGEKFWQFISDRKYKNKTTSTQKSQLYRFTKPENESFSKIIEIFSRNQYGLKNEDIIAQLKNYFYKKKGIQKHCFESLLNFIQRLPKHVQEDL